MNQTEISAALAAIDARVRVVERLVWISFGGVLVMGGIASIIGGKILHILST